MPSNENKKEKNTSDVPESSEQSQRPNNQPEETEREGSKKELGISENPLPDSIDSTPKEKIEQGERELENLVSKGFLDKEIKKITEQIEKLKEQNEEMKKDKNIFLVVFGVFASIIAFFSVEFQILKSVSGTTTLVGFSILLLSSVLLFNFFIHMILRNHDPEPSKKNTIDYKSINTLYVAIIFLLFVGGTLIVIIGDSRMGPDEENLGKIKMELQKDQVSYHDNLIDKIISLESKIISMKNKFDSLERKSDSLALQLKSSIKNKGFQFKR